MGTPFSVLLGRIGLLTLALGVGACRTPERRADVQAPTPAAADAAAGGPTAGGPRCGQTTCAPGEICCNASCGICTPPDGVCTQQLCEEPPAPKPTPPPAGRAGGAACTSDADCRLFSDYCTGCDCRALAAGAPDPTCSGPGVRCLADPCLRQAAACAAGRCVARPAR